VSEAFSLLDQDPAHRGAVPAATLIDAYDPATHPDVLMGLRGADDVRAEFLRSFDGGADVDDHVSKHEFIGYPAIPPPCPCLALPCRVIPPALQLTSRHPAISY